MVDRKGPGPQPLLSAEHRAALAAAIEAGPTPAIHGVVRWRIVDLAQWLQDEFQVAVSKQTLGRELRAMGWNRLAEQPWRVMSIGLRDWAASHAQ